MIFLLFFLQDSRLQCAAQYLVEHSPSVSDDKYYLVGYTHYVDTHFYRASASSTCREKKIEETESKQYS